MKLREALARITRSSHDAPSQKKTNSMKFATLFLAATIAFGQEQPEDANHAAIDERGDHTMGFSHEKTTLLSFSTPTVARFRSPRKIPKL